MPSAIPEGRTPFRVADSEAGNLPARFDAGWYLQIATYGYEYLPNRFDRQQNLVFFPAFPVLMSLALAAGGPPDRCGPARCCRWSPSPGRRATSIGWRAT